MIKNERQYHVTKAQTEKLERALEQSIHESARSTDVHPLLLKAQHDALRSQIDELRSQLAEYESLRVGEHTVIDVASFDQLPRALIQARIAAGLSQRELADRLGLKEQQIQRYEATDYTSASFARIREVVRALGLAVREDVFLPNNDLSLESLFRRLKAVGLDRQFVLDKIVPRSLVARLEANEEVDSEAQAALALQVASAVSRVYGWAVSNIFGGQVLQPNLAPAAIARFKLSARVNGQRTSAYTVYTHYLALLMIDVTAKLPKEPVPTDWREIRHGILERYGAVTFANTVRYAWSKGIAVLPLNDPGAFHGACWRVGGRNVIVLKQRTMAEGRWLFDLLHELHHASQNQEVEEFAIVEANETAPERRESVEEKAASAFAGNIILNGRANELAQLCVSVAQGKMERLKAAVARVALQEGVPVDGLANYVAFRLSLDGQDWWGAAQNLQQTTSNPWEVARDQCISHIDWSVLNESDRILLLQALTDSEHGGGTDDARAR